MNDKDIYEERYGHFVVDYDLLREMWETLDTDLMAYTLLSMAEEFLLGLKQPLKTEGVLKDKNSYYFYKTWREKMQKCEEYKKNTEVIKLSEGCRIIRKK